MALRASPARLDTLFDSSFNPASCSTQAVHHSSARRFSTSMLARLRLGAELLVSACLSGTVATHVMSLGCKLMMWEDGDDVMPD